MARPRIIRLDDGKEIHMKNFSTEEADALTKKVLGEGSIVIVDEGKSEPAKELEPKKMTASAVGTFKSGKSWMCATIKFNPDTGEAFVEKIENCGDYKAAATERFKINAANLELV